MKKDGFFINFHRHSQQENSSGQIAILIVLLVAVIFVFIAVTLNLGQIAQTKAMVSVAADSGAFNFGSMVSSYVYALSVQYLRGYVFECDYSLSGTTAVVAIVIAIILTLLGQPHGIALVLAIIGIGLSIGALYIQVAYIEPGICDAWNKEMARLSKDQQYVETGMRAALMQVVTDNERIADVNDRDMDGKTNDYINRFGDWYRSRLVTEKSGLDSAIQDFVWNHSSGLQRYGLYDPNNSSKNTAYRVKNYWGQDDHYEQGQPPPSGYPDYMRVNGIFVLFYDIDNTIHGDLNRQPYDIVNWTRGEVTCPPTGCSPTPGENDEFDSFRFDLERFTSWANDITGHTADELTTTFSEWFLGSLYNGGAPGNTFYDRTVQWISWLNTWLGNSPGTLGNIRSRMVTERDYIKTRLDTLCYSCSTCPTSPFCEMGAINVLLGQITNAQNEIASLSTKISNILVYQDQPPEGSPVYTFSPPPPPYPYQVPDFTDMWSDFEWLRYYWNFYSWCSAQPPATECRAHILEIWQYRTDGINAFQNIHCPPARSLQIDLANTLGVPYEPHHNNEQHAQCLGNYIPDARDRINYLQNTVIPNLIQQLRAWHLCCTGGYCCSGDNCCTDAQVIAAANARIAYLTGVINAAINDLKNLFCPACCYSCPGGFICPAGCRTWTNAQLIQHATNHYNMLNGMIPRIDEAIGVLTEFRLNTQNFQTQVLNLYSTYLASLGTSYRSTYCWEDKQGLHHIARVEVSAPCQYPYIGKDDADWLTDCYVIFPNFGKGYVGVKVTRFDQDKPNALRFAGGRDLWRFIFYNPSKGSYTGDWSNYCEEPKATSILEHGVTSVSCMHYGRFPNEIYPMQCPADIPWNACHDNYN